jgi:hypothetical protein
MYPRLPSSLNNKCTGRVRSSVGNSQPSESRPFSRSPYSGRTTNMSHCWGNQYRSNGYARGNHNHPGPCDVADKRYAQMSINELTLINEKGGFCSARDIVKWQWQNLAKVEFVTSAEPCKAQVLCRIVHGWQKWHVSMMPFHLPYDERSPLEPYSQIRPLTRDLQERPFTRN